MVQAMKTDVYNRQLVVDEKPILTQATAKADPELQSHTGAVTGPIGANVGFMGNVLLGGATGAADAIFNNTYYGKSSSALYAGGVGALAGAGGYLTGLATTQGFAQVTRPFVYPNLDPKVPALLQGIRNPFPGFGGAMGGSVVQGATSFVPSKGDQK